MSDLSGSEPTKVCLGCGRSLPVSYVACPHCGAQQQGAGAAQPAPQVVFAQPATKTCLGCGIQIPMNSVSCPHCMRPVGAIRAQTNYAMIGGILVLLGALIGLLIYIAIATNADFIASTIKTHDPNSLIKEKDIAICGGIGALLCLAGIIGAIFAMMKKFFVLTILGAIAGMLVAWVPFIIPSILCLIGLILIVLGKDEFK